MSKTHHLLGQTDKPKVTTEPKTSFCQWKEKHIIFIYFKRIFYYFNAVAAI